MQSISKQEIHSELEQQGQFHLDKKVPLTSDNCIIFPFDKAKLRYLRDTYKKILIRDICSPEKITQVISDIESACDNFKEHLFYRKVIRISLLLGALGFIVGLGLIIAGLIISHQSSYKLSPAIHASGLHYHTVVGMIIISLSVIMVYLVIIKVGYSTKDLNMMYIAKYDKVLASYRKTFLEIKMRWRIGVDRMWLELWLDYNKGQPESHKTSKVDSGRTSKKTSVSYMENEELSKVENMSIRDIDELLAWEQKNRSRAVKLTENNEKDFKQKGSSKFEIAARQTFAMSRLSKKGSKEE